MQEWKYYEFNGNQYRDLITNSFPITQIKHESGLWAMNSLTMTPFKRYLDCLAFFEALKVEDSIEDFRKFFTLSNDMSDEDIVKSVKIAQIGIGATNEEKHINIADFFLFHDTENIYSYNREGYGMNEKRILLHQYFNLYKESAVIEFEEMVLGLGMTMYESAPNLYISSTISNNTIKYKVSIFDFYEKIDKEYKSLMDLLTSASQNSVANQQTYLSMPCGEIYPFIDSLIRLNKKE